MGHFCEFACCVLPVCFLQVLIQVPLTYVCVVHCELRFFYSSSVFVFSIILTFGHGKMDKFGSHEPLLQSKYN